MAHMPIEVSQLSDQIPQDDHANQKHVQAVKPASLPLYEMRSEKTEGPTVISDDNTVDELVREWSNLSPNSREGLRHIIANVSKGKATIDYDKSGKPIVDYKKTRPRRYVDGSRANTIETVKSDVDCKQKMEACLEMIEYLKKERPPKGICFDAKKIKLKGKQYVEGRDFIKTKQVLGSGNCAGDVIVVKDRTTGEPHALKSMMICVFCENEVRCWRDMLDTSFPPQLYLFRVEDNRVHIHMEILKQVKTLRSIIDDHMAALYEKNSLDLIKPFSLFILDGCLSAISKMNDRTWTHNDLHAGNVMVQHTQDDGLAVRVIDFGLAQPLSTELGGLNLRGFRSDVAEVLRIFSGLYTFQEFDNAQDIQNHSNRHTKLEEIRELLPHNAEDKEEMFCLIDVAMGVFSPGELLEFRQQVKEKKDKAMTAAGGERDVLRRVAAILFPESYGDLHSRSTGYSADSVDTGSLETDCCNVTDSIGASFHGDGDIDINSMSINVTDEDLETLRRNLSITVKPQY